MTDHPNELYRQAAEQFLSGRINFGYDPDLKLLLTKNDVELWKSNFHFDPNALEDKSHMQKQQDLISQNLVKKMEKNIRDAELAQISTYYVHDPVTDRPVERKTKTLGESVTNRRIKDKERLYWMPMGYLYGHWLFNKNNDEWMIVSPEREEAYFTYYADNPGAEPKVRMQSYNGKKIEREITPFEFFEEACQKVVIGGDFEHKVKQNATSEIDRAYRRGYDEGYEAGQEEKVRAVNEADRDGFKRGYDAAREDIKAELEDFLDG
jgi:hypothetical protein